MPDKPPATQPAEICGEVGTSFATDHEPHYTDPCRLPADHDELHDWAQREADGEPSPAQLADRLATVTRERDEALQDVQSLTDDLSAVRTERDQIDADLAEEKTDNARLERRCDRLTAERDERLTLAESSNLAKMVDDLRDRLKATSDAYNAHANLISDVVVTLEDWLHDTTADGTPIEHLLNRIRHGLREGPAPVPGSLRRVQEPGERVLLVEIRLAIRQGLMAYPNHLSEGMDAAAMAVARLLDQRAAGESQASEPAEYLIWSHHHKAWFAPNGCGYRSDITDAGRYALDATKRWLGRGCGCCLVPEVVIPAPGPKVLAMPGSASHWASTHIEAATNARIGGGQVNSWAAGESPASEPALTAQCQCGHPHAAHEGPGLPARRCVLCFGCNAYVAELPAQDTAATAAPKLAQGGIVNLGPTRRRAQEAGDRVEDGGMMGTLVRCEMCGGSGLLHQPDELPETVAPKVDEPTDDEIAAEIDRAEAHAQAHAQGYAEAVARLRDDDRYRDWWTARPGAPGSYPVYWDGPGRTHLADYLETVGPDGVDVETGRWPAREQAVIRAAIAVVKAWAANGGLGDLVVAETALIEAVGALPHAGETAPAGESQACYPPEWIQTGMPPLDNRVDDAAARDAFIRDGHADVAGESQASEPAPTAGGNYVLVTSLVTEDGEQGHPFDVIVTRVDLDADGAPLSLDRLMERIGRDVRRKVATRRPTAPKLAQGGIIRHDAGPILVGEQPDGCIVPQEADRG